MPMTVWVNDIQRGQQATTWIGQKKTGGDLNAPAITYYCQTVLSWGF